MHITACDVRKTDAELKSWTQLQLSMCCVLRVSGPAIFIKTSSLTVTIPMQTDNIRQAHICIYHEFLHQSQWCPCTSEQRCSTLQKGLNRCFGTVHVQKHRSCWLCAQACVLRPQESAFGTQLQSTSRTDCSRPCQHLLQ